MADDIDPDISKLDEAATLPATMSRKGRPALSKVPRELSTEEFSSAAVQKLLMDDLDRLQGENEDLKGYVERYHAADKRVGVLEEQLKRDRAEEALFSVSLSAGSALLGLAPSAWAHQPLGTLLVGFGIFLLGMSAYVRFRK